MLLPEALEWAAEQLLYQHAVDDDDDGSKRPSGADPDTELMVTVMLEKGIRHDLRSLPRMQVPA